MYEYYSEDNLGRNLGSRLRWKRGLMWLVLLVGFFFLFHLITPPLDFPSKEIITIESGASLSSISEDFQERGLVRSAGIFESLVVIVEGDRGIAAGDYVFEAPLNAIDLARRVTGSEFGIGKISVTLPEGLTTKDMAVTLAAKLQDFNEEEFIFLAKDLEGYLFPDTYFFFATTDAEEVLHMLQQTFEKKVTNKLAEDFAASGKSVSDIMIMASIIQAEAHAGYEEKQIISGILWNRLSKGMRLQVDATLKYYTGRGSADLTISDLSDDHPYNTYTRGGLPPTPIGNPGIDAIRAALHPKASEYLFYLHDSDGKIRYASTFEEHKKNISAYLK